jgi:hypothetical protein
MRIASEWECALTTNWKCCILSYAHCLGCALVSHSRAVPEAQKSLKEKELIHKAKSHNTYLSHNLCSYNGTVMIWLLSSGFSSLSASTPFLLKLVNCDRPWIFPIRACSNKTDPFSPLMMRSVLEQNLSSSVSSLSESFTGVRISRFLERVILLVSRLMICSWSCSRPFVA